MANYLTKMWRRIKHYYIPHYWYKLRGETLSEKGYRFIEYCARVYMNPAYEPQTYEEMMFDEKIGKENRKDMAVCYIKALGPYLDLSFGDNDGTTE